MHKKYGVISLCGAASSSLPLLSFCSTQLFFLSLPEFVTVVKWRMLCALGVDGSK